jgi:hypothetical protein
VRQAEVAGNKKCDYGYLWWVATSSQLNPIGLSQAPFFAEGNWRQQIFVVPDRRLVVILRGYIPSQYILGKPGDEQVIHLLELIMRAYRAKDAGQYRAIAGNLAKRCKA